MEVAEAKCPQCGRPFHKVNPKRVYCSKRCQEATWRSRNRNYSYHREPKEEEEPLITVKCLGKCGGEFLSPSKYIRICPSCKIENHLYDESFAMPIYTSQW